MNLSFRLIPVEERKKIRTNNKILLEKSKQKVIRKYPELNNPMSTVSILYSKILDSNPKYLALSNGPELAMIEMERKNGDQLNKVKCAHCSCLLVEGGICNCIENCRKFHQEICSNCNRPIMLADQIIFKGLPKFGGSEKEEPKKEILYSSSHSSSQASYSSTSNRKPFIYIAQQDGGYMPSYTATTDNNNATSIHFDTPINLKEGETLVIQE